MTEELGQRWEIARNYFRLRACCNPIYAALDALEDILTELRPSPASIERIDVATYRFAANMREPDPVNYFAAKYSLPHAAAALVLRGNAGYHAFTDEAVRDPAIAAFRRRVAVREDPELSAHVPRLKPARVTVTFTDGRQVTRLRESARGDYQDPYGEDEVRSKFRELAGLVLSPAGVARVEALVDRLDDLPRLGDLVDAAAGGSPERKRNVGLVHMGGSYDLPRPSLHASGARASSRSYARAPVFRREQMRRRAPHAPCPQVIAAIRPDTSNASITWWCSAGKSYVIRSSVESPWRMEVPDMTGLCGSSDQGPVDAAPMDRR